jgi:hypothetical protein
MDLYFFHYACELPSGISQECEFSKHFVSFLWLFLARCVFPVNMVNFQSVSCVLPRSIMWTSICFYSCIWSKVWLPIVYMCTSMVETSELLVVFLNFHGQRSELFGCFHMYFRSQWWTSGSFFICTFWRMHVNCPLSYARMLIVQTFFFLAKCILPWPMGELPKKFMCISVISYANFHDQIWLPIVFMPTSMVKLWTSFHV